MSYGIPGKEHKASKDFVDEFGGTGAVTKKLLIPGSTLLKGSNYNNFLFLTLFLTHAAEVLILFLIYQLKTNFSNCLV